MAYLHYNHTHTRERSRSRERSPIFSSPLIRRNSKRQRIDLYDDDSFDDYPHNTALTKPSRALTIREPNQLEKLNIWSAPTSSHHHHHRRHHHHHRRDSFDHEDSDHEHEHDHLRIRHIHRRSVSRGRSPSPSRSDSDLHIQESDRDREFRLKIKAAVSIPRRNSLSISHHHHHQHQHQPASAPSYWPGDWFRSRSREKWLHEDFESRERRGHATTSCWPDEEPKLERKVTFRRIKRTKTDEWKPLQGLRRYDWKD